MCSGKVEIDAIDPNVKYITPCFEFSINSKISCRYYKKETLFNIIR